MKRLGNVFSDVCAYNNLLNAHKRASAGKKHYVQVKLVNSDLDETLQQLQLDLLLETYQVGEYSTSILHDRGKDRLLMKLPYRDRIVQWAIMLQLHGMFMGAFNPFTCAAIKGRGIHYAKKLVQKYLKDADNSKYCLKFDVKKFYESVDHGILKQQLRRKIKDPYLLRLLDKIIDSVGGGVGLPIGSLLSQNLANLYLTDLDNYLKHQLKVKYVVRYMDDVVILSGSKEYLHDLYAKIKAFLGGLKLTIKDNWQVFPVAVRGIDFVGYRMFGKYTLLRKNIAKRFKRVANKICKRALKNKRTSKKDAMSLSAYNGWVSHCNSHRLRRKYGERLLRCGARASWMRGEKPEASPSVHGEAPDNRLTASKALS